MATRGESTPLVPTTAVATPVATEMVDVVAPETMPEGYTFDAQYGVTVFSATVPVGGVVKGQRFAVPFAGAQTLTAMSNQPPQGQWKDGLCACLKFGLCHPSLLNAMCCAPILMAQVLTRMKMNWLGQPAPEEEWRKTFRRVLYILVAYYVAEMVLQPMVQVEYGIREDGTIVQVGPSPPAGLVVLYRLIETAFGLYVLVLLTRLRWFVRKTYRIPEQYCSWAPCSWFEDICCSFWCGCCTVAQLARHTADYNEKRAICCSETGLPPSEVVLTV